MRAERILLDTTVQLWRIVYGPEEGAAFDRELIDKLGVFTTSFVFREYLNTIISDVEYVHIQASEILVPDDDGRVAIGRLAQFLGTGRGNYSSRSIRRLHLVMGKVLDSFKHTRVRKSRLLARLEGMADRWIWEFFRYSDKSGVPRPIVCLTTIDDTPDELEKMKAARPFPPRPAFPKAVGPFLDERKEVVARVEAKMAETPKKNGGDKKLVKVLGWLKAKDGTFDFAGKLREYKEWNWVLGDLLIALETPADVAIYSTDRAFSVLTSVLGKHRYLGHRVPPDSPDRRPR